MWFKNIFRPRPKVVSKRRPAEDGPLFDENFLRRLERLSIQDQRTLRGNPSAGEHQSLRHLPASIFSEHRPYTIGDDLRYVDWNAYARHDTVFLKLGEAEQDVDVHLLLDASRSMAWGQPPKLRAAQRMVAALGYLSLAHSDRLSVFPFGAAPGRPFGPASGKGRLVELFRYLTAIPLQQQTDLGQVLQNHARNYRRGGLLVLSSDLLVATGLAEGLRALPPPRWQVLVLHLIDPHEINPRLQGALELEDIETGQRLPFALDEDLLALYRQNVAAWQENLALTCARHGAKYAQVLTTWPLEQRIVPYLRARRWFL